MAFVVLVLWLFTAGAGIYLLLTSNLARSRPAAAAPPVARPAQPQSLPGPRQRPRPRPCRPHHPPGTYHPPRPPRPRHPPPHAAR